MALKQKLFIGSSSEGLNLAKKVEKILSADFDVTIWNSTSPNDRVFGINENTLNALFRAALEFDFCVLIGTSDDKVTSRKKKSMQARDNVLFELGMFIGRLGTSKCAFLIEKNVKIPSDFGGITLNIFDKSKRNDLRKEVVKIKEHFLKASDDDVNFFPSTTLAAVYFENFIKPVCTYFSTDASKRPSDYKIKIFIPQKITPNVNQQFEELKKKIKTKPYSFNYAGRSRNVLTEVNVSKKTITVVDFPTTIAGIDYAVSNLFQKHENNQQEQILQRELERFINTLNKLLKKHNWEEHVTIVRDKT
jgi:hypothetical protein